MILAMIICSGPCGYDDRVKVERKRLRGIFRADIERASPQATRFKETGYGVGRLQQFALKTMPIIKEFGSENIVLFRENMDQIYLMPAKSRSEQKSIDRI